MKPEGLRIHYKTPMVVVAMRSGSCQLSIPTIGPGYGGIRDWRAAQPSYVVAHLWPTFLTLFALLY